MSSKPQGAFRRTLRSGAVVTAAVAAFSISAPAIAAGASTTTDASTLTQTTTGAVQQGADLYAPAVEGHLEPRGRAGLRGGVLDGTERWG